MTIANLSIVGVGPGDPELLTLKAARVLSTASLIYVPASHLSRETWLRDVVDQHASDKARIREVSFSADRNPVQRKLHWQTTAEEICDQLKGGESIAFVTLGDPQLYSTSYYLLQALKDLWSDVPVEIIPGISSVSHAAALTHFALGTTTRPLTIIPSVKVVDDVRKAFSSGGTLVLMKIGKFLPDLIELLEQEDLIDHAVFIARAGLPGQRIETDLRRLRGEGPETGNLAVILIQTEGKS